MLTGWDVVQARVNERRANSAHAAGTLAFHVQACQECLKGSLCKWAVTLSTAAGKSVYIIPCPCGSEVRSHEPKAKCPDCNRELVVENWGKLPTQSRGEFPSAGGPE